MTLIFCQNIQKALRNREKLQNVIDAVRTMPQFPEILLFTEVSTATTAEMMLNISLAMVGAQFPKEMDFSKALTKPILSTQVRVATGSTLLTRTVVRPKLPRNAKGLKVGLLKPTKKSSYTTEKLSELFAMVRVGGTSEYVAVDNSLLEEYQPKSVAMVDASLPLTNSNRSSALGSSQPLSARETRSGGAETMFGTRFLGRFKVHDKMTGYLCHPSPTNAIQFFKHTVGAISAEHPDGNFFICGDINLEPDQSHRITKMDLGKYLEMSNCRAIPPKLATHSAGKIDWVIAGKGVRADLKECDVLTPGMGGAYSDHFGIYFEV